MSGFRFARWMTVSLAAVCFGMAADSARAAVIINVQQFGPNVVATASGSLNLAGLTQEGRGATPTSAYRASTRSSQWVI